MAAPFGAAVGQRGYSLSEENTPFETPRERRGESPSTPALRDWGLKSCTRCAIGCLPSVAARRFGLLLLPAAALPACRQSSAISVYFGFYLTCRCLPRRGIASLAALFALSVEGGKTSLAAAGTTENVCTTDRRKLGCTDGRSAERQRMQEAEANRIATTMAASEAMPPRRALPFPRRRTPSSCKPAMQFSLGGSKGGVSLFQKEIPLPCLCSAGGAALPFTASVKLPAHDSYTPACRRLLRAR